jgi:hypothetical protein
MCLAARGALVLLLAASAAFCRADSVEHKLFIGWDHGVSFRYCPRPALGFGLVVQPSSFFTLYASREGDQTTIYDNNSSASSTYDSRTGATAFLEVLYRRRIGSRFYLTPYLSLGGRYTTQTSSYSHEFFADTISYGRSESSSETRTIGFVGQVGVMPGVMFGPVSIEFRLGVGGLIASTDSPGGTTSSTDMTEKEFYLVYPADLMAAIVLHIGFR